MSGMQKAPDLREREEELLKRLEYEHELFYYKMIARPSGEVYHECSQIQFHECIYEYFLYCDSIRAEYVDACLYGAEIFGTLYSLFLEQESLCVTNWEGIEELMEAYIAWQKLDRKGAA